MLKMTRRISLALSILLYAALPACLAQAPAADSPEVERRVSELLTRLSLEEKIDLLGGVEDFYVRALPSIGLPRLKMADGPVGVRNWGPSSAMAGGIGLAATWDTAVAERVAREIGRDARARGVHFMLGPGTNIYRAPMNGRNFEYFGEDPFLASRIVVAYINGLQSQGVSATVKHFIGNNSEYDRHNTDSIIDERAMREIYLPAFEAAVKEARTGSVMDSYNLTNGVHMTQNGALNIDIAKREWGFTGIMMSDWDSTYDAVAAANGGLDLEMPSGRYLNREKLLPAVQQGSVSAATIDDKVRRILRVAVQLGWLDRDQTDSSIPLNNPAAKEASLQAAREGMVLLKNDASLLPLDKAKIKTILITGPDADPAVPVAGGSARVVPFAAVSFLQGLKDYLGSSAKVLYSKGISTVSEMAQATSFSTAASGGQTGLQVDYFATEDLRGAPVLSRVEQHVDFGPAPQQQFPGHTKSSRWAGYFVPPARGSYDFFVESTGEDGGFYRLSVDDKVLLDDWQSSREKLGQASLSLDSKPHKVVLEHHGHSFWLGARLSLGIVRKGTFVSSEAKEMARKADAVVVAVGFDAISESEAADRTFALPPGQDELIQQMGAANKKTIVVVTSGGGVDCQSWLAKTPALLEAWYPGQEGGTALAEILFGEATPSGRLPITIERRWEDNPVHDSYYPDAQNRVVYKEGVFVGYRGYEHNGTRPLFPFGYGLSYTSFSYSNLSVSPATGDGGALAVAFDVANTGSRPGAEVAQVYVGDSHAGVPRPAKELKGFARVELKPGEKKHVTVQLDRRALSYFDVNAHQWRADPGDFALLVGRSSAQIELTGKFTLTGSSAASAGQ